MCIYVVGCECGIIMLCWLVMSDEWVCHGYVTGVALNISEKQRRRLQQQAMAMSHYCGMMCDRAKSMLLGIHSKRVSEQLRQRFNLV